MTVVLENVTIRYGRTVAVDAASFTLPRGAVGLLGRNGAGKSSILKAMLGLVRPASGSMRILDLPTSTSPLEVRRRIGYMPERDCHVPGLSGYELCRRIKDSDRSQVPVLLLTVLNDPQHIIDGLEAHSY